MKKIGILSGTFDPIHKGHIAFAQAAIEQEELDEVLILIEKQPRYKHRVTPYSHRLAMARLATQNISRILVLEVGESQFTIATTLPKLLQKYPKVQLYMLMGSDVLGHLSAWENLDDLMQAVTFIVARRPQYPIEDMPSWSCKILKATLPAHASSQIRRGLQPDGLDKKLTHYIADNKLYTTSSSSSK